MAIVYWYLRDFILFIADIVGSFLYVFGQLVNVLIHCVGFLGSVISSLPTFLTIGVTALVIVCVLYKILGRESSS